MDQFRKKMNQLPGGEGEDARLVEELLVAGCWVDADVCIAGYLGGLSGAVVDVLR